EVAHGEDRLDVLRRNRRRVHRIGQVRDEAAVLAEHFRQASADAGRTEFERGAQDLLVDHHRIAGFNGRSHKGTYCAAPVGHAAIALLTGPTEAAGSDSARRPAGGSRVICRGWAARSPHSDSESPRAAALRTIMRNRASNPGCAGSANSLTARLSRAAAIEYCSRSFEPIEAKSISNTSSASAAAGTSTMIPSGGTRYDRRPAL